MNSKIYKIINDINNKVYVGQTRKSLQKRFYDHCRTSKYENRKMAILYAIKKYGKDHFRIELLEELSINLTKKEIDQKEIDWGIKLNSLSPNGYNLRLGNGKNAVSDETRKKIGLKHKGKRLSEWHKKILLKALTGRKRSQEEKDKISKNHSKFWKGKIRSDEDKLKMSKPKTFENGISPLSIPICAYCNNSVYEFKSFAEASKSTIFDKPVAATAICKCCKEKQNSCGKINGKNVIWKYKIF